MGTTTSKPYTADQFKVLMLQPEYADRLFELINGRLVEVSPRGTVYSEIASLITVAVHLFCREYGPCHTSGKGGAYQVGEHVVAPDFAYKPTPMIDRYPDPVPPLFVAEVLSCTDLAIDVRAKRHIYREAGILLWEIYPDSQSVDVYALGKGTRKFGINGVLDGGNVLPGFTVSVSGIFPDA